LPLARIFVSIRLLPRFDFVSDIKVHKCKSHKNTTSHGLCACNAEDGYVSTYIGGAPGLYVKIAPSIYGDNRTVATIVNSIPQVFKASSFLVSTKDMPIPSAAPKDKREFIHQ
jgi:hypothetical protein